MDLHKNRLSNPSVSLIVPVLNEEESIKYFLSRVRGVFDSYQEKLLEIIFIDDGSRDNTASLILEETRKDQRVKIIELSRNFGKEAALTAGLRESKGQVVVPIDVDLQDPPEIIPLMIAKWQEGTDVVLARRVDRSSDTWQKRVTAALFYKFHNKISEPKLAENVGDFRLMDRKVVDELNQLNESHRFMKGLFAWVGFQTEVIEYKRDKRETGKSKFKGFALLNFAIEGLTSFSTFPLRIWSYIGFSFAFLSVLLSLVIAFRVVAFGVEVPGYASVFVGVTFLGGLQLLGVGIIGEYVGRTYIESKNRPVYIIKK